MAGTAEAIDLDRQAMLSAQVIPHLRLVESAAEPAPPTFISIAELDSDKMTRQRAAHFIGDVLTSRMVEDSEFLKLEKPINSLRDGIHWAAQGDEDGVKLVDTNIETDMIERTLKSGHVMDPVPLTVLPGGKIMQYNQTGDAIQRNSLQINANHLTLRPRTEAETRNHFRDEDLLREGRYDNYSKLVISLAENDDKVFFTETMSCSLQLTSKAGNGLQLESAFVAGIAEKGAERHDLKTVIALGDMIGIDFRGMTIAEIIGTPVLIHNSFVKNGVIDVVEKLWDKAASSVVGESVFFGETKQAPCSYQEYLQRCREQTKTFKPRAVAVRNQLISEKDQIKTRTRAIERLHELSEAQMVRLAIEDDSIDLRFMGAEAAQHAAEARYFRSIGDEELARQATKEAIRTADSKSCPWDKISAEMDEENGAEASDEDCDFISKECPECGQKNVKTIVRSLGKGKGRRVSGSCGCSKTYH